MRKLFLIIPMILSGCFEVVSYDGIEDVAVDSLSKVQERSIREEREYCGWVLYDEKRLFPSDVVPGSLDRCKMPEVPRNSRIVASFHTHGNHSPEYYSEIPSQLDVAGEIQARTFGFVSTPGGRVWVIDPFERLISEVCGEGCLPVDPNYDRDDYGYIPSTITTNQLYAFFR